MSDEIQIGARVQSANRGFTLLVVGSLVLHAVLFGVAAYAQASRPTLDVTRSAIPVQLVKLGKKRDPNLLPRKVEPVAAPPPESTGVALDTKNNSDKPSSGKKTPTKLSDAARRLLEGSSTQMDKALSKIEDQEGDPEGSIYGTTTDATNAAAGYDRAITEAMQRSYRLPEAIPANQRQFLKARVALFIDSDGSVKRYEFIEKHPNEIFMGALESLLKSIKLPPPPASRAREVRDTGVEILFRP